MKTHRSKIPRKGTWVTEDGLDHTLFQEDFGKVAFTGCGLTPYLYSDGHALRAFLIPTCIGCLAAPTPDKNLR